MFKGSKGMDDLYKSLSGSTGTGTHSTSHQHQQHHQHQHQQYTNPSSSSMYSAYNNSATKTSTTTSTSASSWNGQQWLHVQQPNNHHTTRTPIPLPPTDLPKVPPHMKPLDDDGNNDNNGDNGASVSERVTFYSAIYAHYDSIIQSCRQRKDFASSEYQWAEYYADLSTRAAHHYNNLVQSSAATNTNSSSTTNSATTSTTNSTTNNHGSQISNTRNTQSQQSRNQNKKPPPASFQQFAHLNLKQCSTQSQKTAMTELIQLTIQQAMQNGTMHTKHWDNEPLLPLPNASGGHVSGGHASGGGFQKGKSYLDAASSHSSPLSSSKRKFDHDNNHASNNNNNNNNNHNNNHNNNNHYQNPNMDHHHKKNKFDQSSSYDDALPMNDSYYGGHVNTTNSNTTSARSYTNAHKTTPTKNNYNDSNYNNNYYNDDDDDDDDDDNGSGSNYYGPTAATAGSNMKKKKKKKTTTTTNTTEFQFGDYISLSSLSTDQYIKTKSNKLVKKTAYSTNATTATTGYTKKNVIQGSLTANNTQQSKLASRLNRFSGTGGTSGIQKNDLQFYSQNIDKYMGKTVIGGIKNTNGKQYKSGGLGGGVVLDEEDYEQMTVKGTCHILEKEYLRLTAPPKAELVRPEHILKTHLENLQKLWKEQRAGGGGNNDDSIHKNGKEEEMNSSGKKKKKKKNKKTDKEVEKKRDYDWFCSQLKVR
jgi:hypothetical protein